MSLWRKDSGCLEIIIIIIFILFFLMLFIVTPVPVSAIRINEVESNPKGNDYAKEWIELYSETEISLIDWKILNYDNDSIMLNGRFSGYLIINFSSQWLDNKDEKVFLINQTKLIDETPLLSDSNNDEFSWSYCEKADEWKFVNSTKAGKNFCQEASEESNNEHAGNNETGIDHTETNQTSDKEKLEQNQTQINDQFKESKKEVIINLDFPDRVYAGKEFDIILNAYNLEALSYDIKICIINEKGKILSEIYNEADNRWKSCFYYVKNALFGLENVTKSFLLRLKDSFDENRTANISAKLREGMQIIAEFSEKIEIVGKKGEEEIENVSGNSSKELETIGQAREQLENHIIRLNSDMKNESKIIRLNSKVSEAKDIKTGFVWKSKEERMKEYALYGFTLFLIFFVIFLIWRKD